MRTQFLHLLASDFYALGNALQEEVYREFYNFLYRPIYSMTHDHSATEDLIQEAFLTTLRKGPAFENEDHLKGWIKVVARNLTINYIRKRSRSRHDISLDANWDNHPSNQAVSDSAEQEFEAKSLEEQIRQHLQDMKPEQRAIIELKWKQGLSYKEIAVATEDTENSVRYKLHRARNYLKKKMDWGRRDE